MLPSNLLHFLTFVHAELADASNAMLYFGNNQGAVRCREGDASNICKARGFKRPALARDTAVVVLEAMNTFVLDAEMQAKGCLVLGWCFYKHLGVARELDKLGVEDTIKKACENFAANVAVNSNAQWALANLHTREEGPGIMGARDAKAIAAITASARAWGE